MKGLIFSLLASSIIAPLHINENLNDSSLFSSLGFNKIENTSLGVLSSYVDGDNKIYLNDINSNDIIEDYWSYDEVKTINIQADFTKINSKDKFITLNIPVGIELISNIDSLVDGVQIVSCDTSEFATTSIKSNNDSYIHKPKSGKLKLKVNNSVLKLSLDLLLKTDDKLWTTQDDTLSHSEEYNAIEISVNELETLKLDKVFISGRDWWQYRHAENPNTVIELSRKPLGLPGG